MTLDGWGRWRAKRRRRADELDELRRALGEGEQLRPRHERLRALFDEITPNEELDDDEFHAYVEAKVERLRAEGRWPYDRHRADPETRAASSLSRSRRMARSASCSARAAARSGVASAAP